MTKKNKTFHRLMSVLLCISLLLMYIPMTSISVAAASNADARVADPSTMDAWKQYFGEEVPSTENAGAVWTDKSVFTDSSAFPSDVAMKDADNNFLVALSAIAANKEIVGYSAIPTDTILVLDESNSMATSALRDMVKAVNAAIAKLNEVNKHNRVGVVVYNGSADVVLPLGRYTANADGDYLSFTTSGGNKISVASGVKNSNDQTVSGSKAQSSGTYTQGGIYTAMTEFLDADTTIDGGQFQGGMHRLPILVLMTDGDPSYASSNYTVANRTNRNRGLGQTNEITFLTQLTAAYAKARISNHYEQDALFYTLGYDINASSNHAPNVLDPANATSPFDSYAAKYLSAAPGESVSLGSGRNTFSVTRTAEIESLSYANECFSASEGNLLTAFDDIVAEIIIQSRYYPTHLEGGSPDFSGYITFVDQIGEYMEVKDIKGILLGTHLFDGAMLTSQINKNGEGLGTIENPTALGLEFINAVKTRLGISSNTDAFTLVRNAFAHGQLSYTDENTFSNYIGWYAAADGSYAGFWQEGSTTAPAGAVYKIKSYGFLGEASGNIKDSDMMYMSVQVQTNIETGEQTVNWKIPAALVPMVTYKVTLDGHRIEGATNVELTIESADPIRLVFEVGLRSDINELNVAQITDTKHIAKDGVTRQFYTNHWDNANANCPACIATTAGFTPSLQNERYYYAEDTVIYQRNGSEYVKVTGKNHSIDVNGEYYHARYIFTDSSDVPVNHFEKISKDTLLKAVWDESYEVGNGTRGAWIIPIRTIDRELESFRVDKTANPTETIVFSNFPYVTLTNASYEADAKLGNNGRLLLTPATGIKLSKQLDTVEPGASNAFLFEITLNAPEGTKLASEYNTRLANLNETTGKAGKAAVVNGKIQVMLQADQTIYITDLPAGTTYTVKEISDNADYKVKSVHVNGAAMNGEVASGIITAYSLDDVDFLNTPTSDGNLVISKEVIHPFGPDYKIPAGLSFTAKVTLTLSGKPLANESFEMATATGTATVITNESGTFTVTLAAGESVSIRGIPEEAEYLVEEIDLPKGFELDESESEALSGKIPGDANAEAVLVNRYTPAAVSPDVTVEIFKTITGRDMWLEGETYEFLVVEVSPIARASYEVIGKITISDASAKTQSFSLSGERYDTAGVYHYMIIESPGATDTGITYDTAERRFHVTVADEYMDGQLEIVEVSNVMNTTVTGNTKDGFKVSAVFNNMYAPISGSSITIPIEKSMADDNYALNGFQFALFAKDDVHFKNPIHESTLTDNEGKAVIQVSYAAVNVGQTFEYKLKELNTGIHGMTYDARVYDVVVTIADNGDGTTRAVWTITKDGSDERVTTPTFINTYDAEDAKLAFSGSKNLIGRPMIEGEFEFNLYQTADDRFELNSATLIQSVTNTANGSFLFDAVSFDKEGIYYFAITESNPGKDNGIRYDDTVHKITVTVKDHGGILKATAVPPAGGILFTNTYTAKAAEVQLTGTKILTGRDILDGEFTFILTDSDGKELQRVTNAGNSFAFDKISYSAAGVYKYTVSEPSDSKDNGIAYDKSVYEITVTVTDNGEGKLLTRIQMAKSGQTASELVFRNSYTPTAATINISGNKTLTGRDMRAGEFKFTLMNALSGEVLGTAENLESGSFSFADLTVHTAGTYHYKVTESYTALGGVSYDTSIYDIYVTVSDNGEGALEETQRKVFKNGEEVSTPIVFENTYKPAAKEIVLQGEKTLTGRDLIPGEFSFNLYAANSAYAPQGAPIETVTNESDGTFIFSSLPVSEPGTWYYVVKEDASAEATGVTYDETVYYVTVTAADDGNGHLLVNTEIRTAEDVMADTLLFCNIFTPADIDVLIQVNKQLENKTSEGIGPDGFVFTLAGNGDLLESVSNEAGQAFFLLRFTAEDIGKTFKYTLSEKNTGTPGMIYSEDTVEITVSISSNSKGELLAKLTQDGAEVETAKAEFTNTYVGVPEETTPTEPDENPKTGNRGLRPVWFALFFLSGAYLLAAFFGRKMKKMDA